jgi:hypothetical protein
MAEVPGTRASLRFITGHWNLFANVPETIHGDSGAPRRVRAKTRRGASRSAAMKKATMGMNFSAMELSVLIHDLKQQQRPIRRLNQSGMRTNDHSLHLNSEMNPTTQEQMRITESCY